MTKTGGLVIHGRSGSLQTSLTVNQDSISRYQHILYLLYDFSLSIGDFTLLTSARLQARERFTENRALKSSSREATEALKHAEDVAQILRHNIVQGEQQEGKDVLSTAYQKIAKTSG